MRLTKTQKNAVKDDLLWTFNHCPTKVSTFIAHLITFMPDSKESTAIRGIITSDPKLEKVFCKFKNKRLFELFGTGFCLYNTLTYNLKAKTPLRTYRKSK